MLIYTIEDLIFMVAITMLFAMMLIAFGVAIIVDIVDRFKRRK